MPLESRFATVSTDRKTLNTVCMTRKEQQKAKWRPRSFITNKFLGNYSMDKDFITPTIRAYEQNGLPGGCYPVNFFKFMAIDTNLRIMQKEYAFMREYRALPTSPSFHAAIEMTYRYMPENSKDDHPLAKCRTSWSAFVCLMECLLHPTLITVDQLKICIIDIKKIVEACWGHDTGAEANKMSVIRNIIALNYSNEVLLYISSLRIFDQNWDRRTAFSVVKKERRMDLAADPISLSYKATLNIGYQLARESQEYVTEAKKAITGDIGAIHTLIATVMLCTGARLTEVILISDFTPIRQRDTNIKTVSFAPMVTIRPTAKGVNEEKRVARSVMRGTDAPLPIDLSSDRVIMFGLQSHDIYTMVELVRAHLREMDPRFDELDKNNPKDRIRCCHMIKRFGPFVSMLMAEANDKAHFTSRSFRGIYAAMSFKIWAKKPMSEIVWINRLLSHQSMDTSISYNKYSLSQ